MDASLSEPMKPRQHVGLDSESAGFAVDHQRAETTAVYCIHPLAGLGRLNDHITAYAELITLNALKEACHPVMVSPLNVMHT